MGIAKNLEIWWCLVVKKTGERPLSLSGIDLPPPGHTGTKQDLACPGNYKLQTNLQTKDFKHELPKA
jgi:hypothetical protein